MQKASLTVAAALAAFVAGAPGAKADPMIVPSSGPLAVVDAFFGGAFFGGGGDGRNAFPFTTAASGLTPSLGCYFTRTRVDGAWRRVEICR
jgi:hypothetical protein